MPDESWLAAQRDAAHPSFRAGAGRLPKTSLLIMNQQEAGGELLPVTTLVKGAKPVRISEHSGRSRRALTAAAMAGVVAVAGCGGGHVAPASTPSHAPAGGSAGQQVTLTGTNALRFSPMTVHVHTGTVRITLQDMGAYPHNLVIPALGIASATVTGDPGGTQVSFTVTLPHPGRYRFHCQYHASVGMVGVLVVS